MLGVKELLIKLLNDIQNIKQKLNKPIIISDSAMTEAIDCSVNKYDILTACAARVDILYQLIEEGSKFLTSLFTPFSYKKEVGVCLM